MSDIEMSDMRRTWITLMLNPVSFASCSLRCDIKMGMWVGGHMVTYDVTYVWHILTYGDIVWHMATYKMWYKDVMYYVWVGCISHFLFRENKQPTLYVCYMLYIINFYQTLYVCYMLSIIKFYQTLYVASASAFAQKLFSAPGIK